MRENISKKNMLPRNHVFRSFATLLGLICVSALLLTGIMLPAVGAVGIATKAGVDFLTYDDVKINIETPTTRSVLLDKDGNKIAQFYAENRIIVDGKNMSPWIRKATVAIEDRRFYSHHGIDPEGVARAIVNNILGGGLQGASTITQQYVKNMLIDKGLKNESREQIYNANKQTLSRKIKEANFALKIEKKYGKEKILTGYLNIAPYGPSTYGIEAASQHYFSKPAKDLSIPEAATLAAIPQSPVSYDPLKYPEETEKRKNKVLQSMLDLKQIDKKQFDEAKAVTVKKLLHPSSSMQGCQDAGNAAYFCSYVVNEIYNNPIFGKRLQDRKQLLLRGGLVIKSTIDSKLQDLATETLKSAIPEKDSSGLSTALSTVEPGTGKILALAQNTTYGKATEANPRNTEFSFNVDQAHGGGTGYQPGSSFKTITLLTWFVEGHNAYEIVGGRNTYSAQEFKATNCDNMFPAPWHFKNALSANAPAGTVLRGTQLSLNTTYAAMASKLDLCKIRKVATDIGAVSGTEKDSELKYGPSYILGTASIPPLNMANAYATIAAHGKYCPPMAINEVQLQTGEKLKLAAPQCKQVVPEAAADKTVDVLYRTYMTYPGYVKINRPAFTKTGTTDGPSAGWIAGGTPNLATAVWMGYSEGNIRPLVNMTINGRYYPVAWGATVPAEIWGKYMRGAHENIPVTPLPNVSIGRREVLPARPLVTRTPRNENQTENNTENNTDESRTDE